MRHLWILVGLAACGAALLTETDGRGLAVDDRAPAAVERSRVGGATLSGLSRGTEPPDQRRNRGIFEALASAEIDAQTEALAVVRDAIVRDKAPVKLVIDILLGRTPLGHEVSDHVLSTCLLWVGTWREQLLEFAPDVCREASRRHAGAQRIRALRVLSMLGPLGSREAPSILALLQGCPHDDNVYEVILGQCAGESYRPLAPRLLHWVAYRDDPNRERPLRIDRRVEYSRGSDGYLHDLKRLGALDADLLRDFLLGAGRIVPSDQWWGEYGKDPRESMLEALADTGTGAAIADVLLGGDASAKMELCLAIRWGVEWAPVDRLLVAQALTTLYADSDGRVRGWALCAMGALKPETTDTLLRALTGTEDSHLRSTALGALCWRASQGIVDQIMSLVRTGEVPADSYAASHLADATGDPSALVPELLDGYCGGVHAVGSLARIASQAPETLVSGFASKRPDVRRLTHHVAATLFEQEPGLAVPAEVMPYLVRSAIGPDSELRVFAAMALAQARPDLAATGLAEALASPTERTALDAASAVARGGRSLRHLLPRLLDARATHAGEEADEVVPRAIFAIVSGDFDVLSSWLAASRVSPHLAVDVLSHGAQDAVDWMSNALADKRDVRRCRVCAEGLRRVAAGQTGSVRTSALAALQQALGDSDPLVRLHAATTCAEAGLTDALDVLLQMLDLPDPPHGIEIISALGSARLTQAQIAVLRRHAVHRDREIAKRVSNLLRVRRLHAD